jgi:hypothetical protein
MLAMRFQKLKYASGYLKRREHKVLSLPLLDGNT